MSVTPICTNAFPSTFTGRARTATAVNAQVPAPLLRMRQGEFPDGTRVLRAKIERGDRLMGFGHRVYRVRDPRAEVLARAAERLFTRGGDMALYALARAVEAEALRLLEEYKPGRRLQTNVEFYTALLLHGLGLDAELFTPTFAIGRVSGWIGHALEQREGNRIIRPQSEYVGPRDLRWIPLIERTKPAMNEIGEPAALPWAGEGHPVSRPVVSSD